MTKKRTFVYCIIGLLLLLFAIAVAASLIWHRKHLSTIRNYLLTQTLPEQKSKPKSNQVPQAQLKVFLIDEQHIALAGDYAISFNNEYIRRYGERLSEVQKQNSQGTLPSWSKQFHFNFSAAELQADFWPQIAETWQNPNYFKLTQNGKALSIKRAGYWPHAIGTLRVPAFDGSSNTLLTDSAQIIPLVYIQLASPLKIGQQIIIESNNGETATLNYDDIKSISSAIKIDQSGYLPDAGQKYAYLGRWLGGVLGAWDNTSFIGKNFHLRATSNNTIQYSGQITLRSREQYTKANGIDMPLNGEIVLEMDFSNFKTPGKYFIQVPGIGRSFDFIIGAEAMGRAFYVQTRGLYLQRCGIAKDAQHTQWTSGICHTNSLPGNFPPDAEDYYSSKSQFTNSSGQKVGVNHFDIIKKLPVNKQDRLAVSGGWHDAADFDRRSYHLDISDQLLSAYLLFPENFSDGQLDLPESDNNIPDIIDEAAYGVEVWRKAQATSGGVGCWIEADSHPHQYNPAIDHQPYFLSSPSRKSSLRYAAIAAKLAYVYKKANQPSLAQAYFASAQKAWDFAMNPDNALKATYELPKLGKVNYEESPTLSSAYSLKAAANLFLYSQDKRYLKVLDQIDYKKAIEEAKNNESAFFLSELLEDPKVFFIEGSQYRKMIRHRAADLLKSQQQLAYRNINWPIDHGYFLYLAWGNANPLRKAAYFVMAYRIDGDAKYRDAALLCANWTLGTNPMGRTATTGLGVISPVHVLSLPYFADFDSRPEPPPGITPYMFTGHNTNNASTMLFSVQKPPRKDHNFAGTNFTLLPKELTGGKTLNKEDTHKMLETVIPIWRRHLNIGSYSVAQNEYSVWETIGPAAAIYGALLPPKWMPPKEWKSQKPISKIEDIPGYIFLP